MSGGTALMIAGWMGILLYGYLNAMLGTVLPNLMEKLNLDKAQAGSFFMVISIGLIVSSVPSGPVIDALGTKMVVCLGLLLVTLAFWGLSRIASPRALYPLAFVLGLGGSMIVAGENTMVSLINPGQRETAANVLNLFFGVGAFIAPFVVMPVLKRHGFSAILMISTLISAATLLLHVSLAFPAAPQAQGFPLALAGSLLTQPKLLLLMFLVFLYVGTEFSIWSWTVTFFTTERKYDQKSASRLVSAFALTIIAGRLVAGWVLGIFGPEKTLLLSAAGAMLCLSTVFRVRARTLITSATLAAGLFMAAIFPTSLGLAGRYFPELVGTAISLVITGGWLGAIAIPPAVGYVAKHRGVARGMLIPVAASTLMLFTPALLLLSR